MRGNNVHMNESKQTVKEFNIDVSTGNRTDLYITSHLLGGSLAALLNFEFRTPPYNKADSI